MDGIEYRMLKDMTKVYKDELIKIFNEIWKNKEMMEEWREYIVFFIDKKDKQKVRPITLSSCIGKIMEKIVNERLCWWTEEKGI